jgi:hypothetical protein
MKKKTFILYNKQDMDYLDYFIEMIGDNLIETRTYGRKSNIVIVIYK